MKIAILGAGAYGKSLGNVAIKNGHTVRFYDPYKFPLVSLQNAISEAEAIIYVAPSDQAPAILPKLPKTTPLICASKGFLSTELFNHFSNFSALGGAAFAKNIDQKSPSFGKKIVLTSSSPLAESLFANEFIHVEYTDDTLGIMLCGALKNIFAIGAGMYDKSQENIEQSSDATEVALAPFMSYLTTAGEEIEQVLVANGANPNTLTLSCGVPDLLLSCDKNSRNFRFGRALEAKIKHLPHEDNDIDGTIEGVFVIKSLPHYPNFKIPPSATLMNEIISKVRANL